MAERKLWEQSELTCKPLDSYEEILSFIENPPSWRSLCNDITPHSEDVLRNIEINKSFGANLLESPQTFCHFDPETENIKRHNRQTLSKTLICHDMANGYHDDSIIDGTGNYDAYTFYNWAAIDVFCYFSHHLVTIPPLAWINVGHAHGVKVIGTLITEWKDGAAFWDKILKSEVEWQNFASALVAIAKTLKFDGWLLNVENKISKPEALLQFVGHLHSLLHEELPAAELLWYDSVTVDGHLNWQNGLTDKNKKFFDVVDGLFTNYSWSVEEVRRSAAAAGARLADLYVGIDVWGRNFHGGGQFNTQQAVQVAHKFGCSLAIFAPAWTHEAMADDPVVGSELTPLEQFQLRERALWGSMWPYLNTRLPCHLPFQTSFCRGQGKKRRLHGEVICPVPWFNLRHMQYQPNSGIGPHGYVLSTQDTSHHISHLLTHAVGVQQYRRSIEASKADVKDDEDGPLATKTVSITTEPEEVEETEDSQDGDRKTVKRKLKTALTNLFKTKSPKINESEEPVPEGNTGPVDVSASMVQLSVRVRLGSRPGKVRYRLAHVPGELECLEQFYEDSFLGGSCLKVNPRDDVSPDHRFARIFHCDFGCEHMIVCVVTKTLVGHEDQFLNVVLHFRAGERRFRRVLIGRSVPQAQGPRVGGAEGPDSASVYPIDDARAGLRRVQSYVLLNEPCFYVPVQNAFGWKVRYYELSVGEARLTTVSCLTGLPEGPILLGHFGLCSRTAPNA